MTALILEPSRFFQNVLETILKDAGFTTKCFSEPADLKDEVSRPGFSCELLCLPLKIRGGTSTAIARELRMVPALKGCPMALITSSDSDEEIQEALRSGITEVFYKSDLQSFQDFAHNIFIKAGLGTTGNYRILYAEDSQSTATLILSWLAAMNATVRHVRTAEEALLIFSQSPEGFDLVLTDFLLAGKMSGLGLIREIRGSLNHRIPILVTSGLEDVTRRVEILKSGANDYVAKPVMEEELRARVHLLVENKRLMDEVESQRKRLANMAMHDPLTGLPNRYSIMEQAPQLMERSLREKAGFSLAIIDVDHFKQANDQLGHQKGDIILIEMGKIIRKTLPEGAFCARMGGEEFLLLFPGTPGGKAWNLCEDLRVALTSVKLEGWNLSASIGVTGLENRTDCTLDQLISEADTAMYQAKEKGRNRVEKFQD